MTRYLYRVLGVVRVVDGDTVDLRIDRGFYDTSVMRFRIAGVNTPELHSGDSSERAEALKAKAFTDRWLSDHFPHGLTVESFKSSTVPDGGFGRWLGAVSCSCGVRLRDALVAADSGWRSS